MTDLKNNFPDNPRLIFMGTPDFAIPTLKGLTDYPHNGLTVVTQPDRRKGRGKKVAAPPVKQLAKEKGLEVLQPEKISDDRFCELIRDKAPDLIIVVAFGQILPKGLLTAAGWGVINIHPSLLPKYRGAAPIQRAVLNNESRTGLTVMRMDEGLDTGPILYQEELTLQRDETAGQLHDRLALMAGDLMPKILKQLPDNPLQERPQDHSRATYADKIGRQMCKIDWNQPAQQISALIRALDPRPGAYTSLGDKDIKLFASRVVNSDAPGGVPGRVVKPQKGGLIVEAGPGAVEIGEVQFSGKKRLPAVDFLRGFPLPEGTLLGQ